MPAIGNKVKKLRELKGYKQEYMAERLGITQQSYSKLESEKTDIPFSRIEQLAEIFEMKPEELVGFDAQYVFNNYGENKGHQVAYNNFPQELKQLYEDKIKLLEEKITYQEAEIARLK
jgi:transcriptional regulator with XRE-family HTH domain